MIAIPVTRDKALEYIRTHHRHHKFDKAGYKFAVALHFRGELAGIALAGRPTSRMLQTAEPLTLEVTRLCTTGTKNACSFLYGSVRRAAFAMGYTRLITYILESEAGSSVKAAGFKFVKLTKGGKWDRPSRRREKVAPEEPKQLWEALAVSQQERQKDE